MKNCNLFEIYKGVCIYFSDYDGKFYTHSTKIGCSLECTKAHIDRFGCNFTEQINTMKEIETLFA